MSDREFAKELRRLRPDWFKNKLLDLAKNGNPRPKKPVTDFLAKYVAYDPDFGKTIRKIRPDWFGVN